MLPLTRAGIWVLFVLAAANGLWLYFLPGQADTDYAWSIKPPVNAAFIGAGFLAGTLATGLVLASPRAGARSRRCRSRCGCWRRSLLAATMIHHDRFKFDYPPTWVWTIVYAGVPFAVPYLVAPPARERRSAPAADPRAERAAHPVARSSAARSWSARSRCTSRPVELGQHWLWPLTPLLARAVAAWYALFGTMLLSCAFGLRRPAEALIPYATLACWCVLLLLLPRPPPRRRQRRRALVSR